MLLHPADDVLWRMTHPDTDFRTVNDGDTIRVAGHELHAIHTPGHSPGSVCWHAPELGAVFSGDTLFEGGPGATGRSYSDFPTILTSISEKLGKLPGQTVVYTGHGESVTPRPVTAPIVIEHNCNHENVAAAVGDSILAPQCDKGRGVLHVALKCWHPSVQHRQ